VNSPGQVALLSFDFLPCGQTLAAGTEFTGEDASILYWDVRKPTAPVHSHSSTHSDDITVIPINHSNNNTLLSASSDGLLCISNPAETDEDNAVTYVGNWGTSIAQAGWLANNVWSASDMEHSASGPSTSTKPQISYPRTQPTTFSNCTTSVGSRLFDQLPITQYNNLSLFLGSNS